MPSPEQHTQLAAQIGERTGNIYSARSICCSESVILTFNQTFRGPLTEELAASLGSGFCHGMGGAGCTCGALAGGEIALGLFLSPRQNGGMKKKDFEELAKTLHDRFKERYAATCCRVLRKRRKDNKGASCQELTVGGAEITAELLLRERPELAEQIDLAFLNDRESKLGALARKLVG